MTAPRPFSAFAPSRRALEFGAQYAEVLERWSELFASASALVRANVELGTMATDSAEEFERWMQGAATGPFGWFNPELMQQFMGAMMGAARPSQSDQ
jgi:hypothetical protein